MLIMLKITMIFILICLGPVVAGEMISKTPTHLIYYDLDKDQSVKVPIRDYRHHYIAFSDVIGPCEDNTQLDFFISEDFIFLWHQAKNTQTKDLLYFSSNPELSPKEVIEKYKIATFLKKDTRQSKDQSISLFRFDNKSDLTNRNEIQMILPLTGILKELECHQKIVLKQQSNQTFEDTWQNFNELSVSIRYGRVGRNSNEIQDSLGKIDYNVGVFIEKLVTPEIGHGLDIAIYSYKSDNSLLYNQLNNKQSWINPDFVLTQFHYQFIYNFYNFGNFRVGAAAGGGLSLFEYEDTNVVNQFTKKSKVAPSIGGKLLADWTFKKFELMKIGKQALSLGIMFDLDYLFSLKILNTEFYGLHSIPSVYLRWSY